jgi:hypothetical protein
MTLLHRVKAVGTNMSQAMGTYHPVGTAATPHVSPAHQLSYAENPGYPWGTATYEDVTPMWAADGALIPSTAPGAAVRTIPAGVASPAHR